MTTGRPEVLFPLFGDLTGLSGIGKKGKDALENLAVFKPKDLLFTLPNGVINRSTVETVQQADFPCVLSVIVEILRHNKPRSRNRPYRVLVRDAHVEFVLIFFHARGDWIEKNLPVGERRIVSGKVEVFDGVAQMAHPDYILREDQADELPLFEPVYPLTAGVTQKTMLKAIRSAISLAPSLDEWIEPSQMAERNWPSWRAGLEAAHSPTGSADLAPQAPSRARLAYDEMFSHQLTLAIARSATRRKKGRSSTGDGRLQKAVLAALPFEPTKAQSRSVQEIAEDLAAPWRMNRLLQGDVGSGKTLVALLAALIVVEAGGQVALMAPTEILARQHMVALQGLMANARVEVEVLTGRDDARTRRQKLERLADGQISILVGTHALFQKSVEFKDLRLAIIDEQHKFGVRERMDLGAKGQAVDILVMTATPIPRSLELTHYGDMDLSVLDEKPAGRSPIDTVMISENRLDQVIARLHVAIAEGRQIYWVCPLVAESEVMEATAAEDRFATLRKELGDGVVGLVHGQMPSADKDAAMADFVAGRTRLLVATTVIEVGVDVPNASIMVIEGAENFGLAQLHQLRGRVGRGSAKSTCLLLYSGHLTKTAQDRLAIMRETNDGFRIAEEDLRIRGAGDVLGIAQSGLPRFRIADPESQAGLMAVARSDARALLELDPKLETPRGKAARVLLYLMDRDQAFRMISVG